MMTENLPVAATDILEIRDEQIEETIYRMIAQKRLSPLMESLNQDILDGSAEVAQRARDALARLGFI